MPLLLDMNAAPRMAWHGRPSLRDSFISCIITQQVVARTCHDHVVASEGDVQRLLWNPNHQSPSCVRRATCNLILFVIITLDLIRLGLKCCEILSGSTDTPRHWLGLLSTFPALVCHHRIIGVSGMVDFFSTSLAECCTAQLSCNSTCSDFLG